MKGICFIQPLFHAVVEGRKTQTGRIVKYSKKQKWIPIDDIPKDAVYMLKTTMVNGIYRSKQAFPRYKVGETLYLKEPYFICKEKLYYRYGNQAEEFMPNRYWKSKLFMPEKFARYFIEITGVRCERLQDISDEDCAKEGVFTKREICSPFNTLYAVELSAKTRKEKWEEHFGTCINRKEKGGRYLGYETPQQASVVQMYKDALDTKNKEIADINEKLNASQKSIDEIKRYYKGEIDSIKKAHKDEIDKIKGEIDKMKKEHAEQIATIVKKMS